MNAAPRLALVEVLGRDGRVRVAVPVTAWPLRIGRAIDNDVVLDDPHVAPHHLRIEARLDSDGAPAGAELLALPSVNGVALARRRLAPGERAMAPGGDEDFVVGATRLRLRLAGEALAPERALARAPRRTMTLVIAALLWGWMLAAFAIQIDPGSRVSDWLLPLLGVPVALGSWCVLWGLASKLFQDRFDFWAHLAVAARGLLAAEVTGFVLPWAAALASAPLLSRVTPGAVALCIVAMLIGQARLVAPQHRRALRIVGWSGFVVGAAILMALNQQRHDRWFSELYVSALPPPTLLWSRPVTPDEFVRGAVALRAPLDAAVRAAERDAAAGRDADAGRDDEGE